ncbi:MAG: hypothetical protein ACFE0O_14475 [Opitutales bacterium]
MQNKQLNAMSNVNWVLGSLLLLSFHVVGLASIDDNEIVALESLSDVYETYVETDRLDTDALSNLLAIDGNDLKQAAIASYGNRKYFHFVWAHMLDAIPSSESKISFLKRLINLSESELYLFSSSAWISYAKEMAKKPSFPKAFYESKILESSIAANSLVYSVSFFTETNNPDAVDFLISVLNSEDPRSPKSENAASGLLIPAYKYSNGKALKALITYREKFQKASVNKH